MSRAFVNEDANQWGDPSRRFTLPDRDDPAFDEAAAEADERLSQLAERFLK
jgi:hypothetical protein